MRRKFVEHGQRMEYNRKGLDKGKYHSRRERIKGQNFCELDPGDRQSFLEFMQ